MRNELTGNARRLVGAVQRSKGREMRKQLLLAIALLIVFAAAVARAQEKQQSAAPAQRAVVPLKIQITFSEYDGDKKIGSLPYTLNHNADINPGRETRTSLRMGIRVPILASAPNAAENRLQYQNVGTDIDCFIRAESEGTFRATFELRRSSLYTPGPDTKQAEWKPNDPAMPGTPFFREFSGRFDALLKDGQSTQTTMATDPVSGRTLRVDVALTVIK